jgi:deoxycytidine triphosphate deaminase
MLTFEQLVPATGYLTDRQITAAVEAGYLMDSGTWTPKGVRHASYTLHLGDKVEVARAAAAAGSETKEFSVVRLQAGQGLELHPGDTALLYSKEQLRIPTCVLGFTVARGLLFAEALSPENTYVDPGFSGPLYTTVTNVSSRVVHLEYGLPVARLFFFRLGEAATNGYRTGAALGIAQQLQSVRAVSIGSPAECQTASRGEIMAVIRGMPFGGVLAEAFDRQELKYRRLATFAVAFPILLVFANASDWVKDNIGPFIGNVAASLVAAALTFGAPRLLRVLGWRE